MNELNVHDSHLKVKTYDYDLQNDSILFYNEGEKYKSSVEFNGIILDFSEEDNLMSIEMLDVSEKFHTSKSDILNLKKFNATIIIDKENIKVTMKMEIRKRNKLFDKGLEALTINSMNLPSSTQGIAVTC
jgi:hypothetical protein